MRTIRSSKEISHIFQSGIRKSTPYVTFLFRSLSEYSIENEHDHSGRVAFIAGKKHGGAVWRNQAKRRMRKICQDLKGPWIGWDVVFLAKPAITSVSYSKVLAVCRKELRRSLLID